MSFAQYLIDTSALVRLLREDQALAEWNQPIVNGLVAICPITELELLHTARSKADRERWLALLRELFGWVVMPERAFERAAEVQAALTAQGTHRSAGPVDLLTSAAAEAHNLVLLHYDADFLQVAQVTGQPTRWVAEPGTLDRVSGPRSTGSGGGSRRAPAGRPPAAGITVSTSSSPRHCGRTEP